MEVAPADDITRTGSINRRRDPAQVDRHEGLAVIGAGADLERASERNDYLCRAQCACEDASGILTAALSCEHHEHDKRHGDNYGDVERRQGHRRHGWPKRKRARAPRGVKRRGPSLHKETMPGRCFAITTGRRDLCRGTGAPALSKHAKDLWNHAEPGASARGPVVGCGENKAGHTARTGEANSGPPRGCGGRKPPEAVRRRLEPTRRCAEFESLHTHQ